MVKEGLNQSIPYLGIIISLSNRITLRDKKKSLVNRYLTFINGGGKEINLYISTGNQSMTGVLQQGQRLPSCTDDTP